MQGAIRGGGSQAQREEIGQPRLELVLRTDPAAHLAAIVQSSDDAILSKTLDGVIVSWNAAAERTYGYAAAEAIGRSVSFVVPPDRQEEHARIMERLRRGEHVRPFQTVRVRKDGGRFDALVTVSPIVVPSGAVIGASDITRDITDRVRAERAQRFLAEASRLLGSSLNYRRTLARVARFAIEQIADWCIIDLIGEDRQIERVVVAASDPRTQALLDEVKKRYPPDWSSPQPAARALRSGKPILFERLTASSLARTVKDKEHLRLMTEIAPRTAMAVPLVSRRRTLGSITFGVSDADRRLYDRRDLALAAELGIRAALAIDNARLFEERSVVARKLQRSLLPALPPEIPGVELAVRYRPGTAGQEVGGDFYDVFERGSGTYFFCVGDVCGKGPDAAALSGLARQTLRSGTVRERRPSRLLALLNEMILEQDVDRFCTLVVGRLRRQGEIVTLTLACGGHPAPLVVRRDGGLEHVGCHGTVVGFFPDARFSDCSVELAAGDLLCVYTDGVTERRRGPEPFGEERLGAALQPLVRLAVEEIAAGAEAAVDEFASSSARDDSILLLLRPGPS